MEEIGGVEEGMMPVFTVLKDGRVLKNIFLNEPPPEQEQGSPMRPRGEEKILVGRHPNSQEQPAADRPNPTRSEGTTRRWHMVADTSCFLDEESRRALQLLEGVRGTHLIVPRMVIRELDCLRRREGLFRKTPRVSPVLQWIEECMVKTSWWIHVQSSMESMPAAPTPPATPQAPPPPALGLTEILSPTADDHILDCAFLFRGIKNDGQLVLLTNEVSLKIKAMAEGLLCESPREFRESLVSPWSERFLWAESSPRGPTWSSADSVAPIDGRHHHRCCPATRRPAKEAAEGARGLKLILLHNSHYAQANLIK
ncbi:unnamed protein product [Spirodela intermedia]|uniref:PIN domain-containing protein n=1 Tax=Spirodela intermedia TaxID=51605 RepID=A0A7I8J337_SPIIN|nr:unnamed protein product [Spirodela intermedia]CAA6663821.1 unnamed protein product [Spirodela intermedia]